MRRISDISSWRTVNIIYINYQISMWNYSVEKQIHYSGFSPQFSSLSLYTQFNYLAPGGGCEVLFSPGLSVCVCVCACVCVCVSVCPANILIFYFSATRRDIDLKLIQDTYRVVLDSLTKFTFIGQRLRSLARYITFWRYSHITKTEP